MSWTWRRYLLAGAVIASSATYVSNAAGSAVATSSVTSVTFSVVTPPSSDSFYSGTLGIMNGRVMVGQDTSYFLTGSNGRPTTERNVCRLAVLQREPLRLLSNSSTNCDNPSLAGQPVVPIESVDSGGTTGEVRISVRTRSDGYRVGPVVMRYANDSDTRPEWTYGGGYLWLFDAAAPINTEVLRISESTGMVLSRVRLPWSARVLLAADDDGLWIGQSPEGGWQKGEVLPLVEFVGNHASVPVVTLQSPEPLHGGRVDWLVASGHTAIAAISELNHAAISAIDTFPTPSTSAQMVKTGSTWEPTSLGEGPADAPPAIEVSGTDLLAAKPGWDGQFSGIASSESVIGINPRTGRDSQLASLRGFSAADFVAYAFSGGALYLLSHANGSGTATLYRVHV